jgi:uncharacterized delta-60 repeat protein
MTGRIAPACRLIGLAALLSALVACSSGDKGATTGPQPAPGTRAGGVIDNTFAIGGTQLQGASTNEGVNAMLGTKTDATLAIGSSTTGDKTGLLLMRVRGDGTPDPSFGAGGRTVTMIGQGAEAWAGITTPDGKITLAGSAVSEEGDADLALARYLGDGSLDRTFGRDGVSLSKASGGPATAFALAVDSASRLVVGGQCGRATSQANNRGTACIARFAANGEIDTGFGQNGIRLLPIRDGVESPRAIAVDARGRIVATGYSAYNATANELTLFRLTAGGEPDVDFGDLGSVAYRGRGFSDAFALALQDDGILVAGFSGAADGSGKDFLVARFSADGSLDRKFGDQGVTMTPIGPGDDVAFALASDPRGIVLAGNACNGKDNDLAVVRYTTAGKLDESFANRGTLTIPRRAMAVARGLVLTDTAITLGGEVKTEGGRTALLARVAL